MRLLGEDNQKASNKIFKRLFRLDNNAISSFKIDELLLIFHSKKIGLHEEQKLIITNRKNE